MFLGIPIELWCVLGVLFLFYLPFFVVLFVKVRCIWYKGSYYKKSRHDVKIDKTS